MTDQQVPFNISITGNNDTKTDNNSKKQNVYENYIVINNQQLKAENDSLKTEVHELNTRVDELDEEVSKEEKRRTYMKGLMHNLVDMKKKTFKMNDKHSEISKSFYDYNTKMHKQVFSKISSQTPFFNYLLC